MSIPVVWTDAHRHHAPASGLWIGVRIPADELPERAEAIRTALEAAGAAVVHAEPHSDDPLVAVHDQGLVEFLRGALANRQAAGFPEDVWLGAVERVVDVARSRGCDALVVALGVDAAAGDPNSRLAVTEAGFRDAGRLLGALRLPTVLVQEGGYVLETIGELVRTTLEGFEQASAS